MKQKIRRFMMLAGGGFALVASILFYLVLYLNFPTLPIAQRLEIAVPPSLILVAGSIAISYFIANRVYEESLRPVRIMVRYLNSLLSGKFGEEAPSMEEEEALGSLLETGEDRLEFLRQLASVRQSETMRRQFSANVSHELKSPLTSINGYAEMIESGMVGPEDTRRFAGIIYREGIRLLNMINEIIQLSKFDTGYSDFDQRESFDLGTIVGDVVETFAQQAKERNVALQVESAGSGTLTMFGNKRLITDVVSNLLSNAIKYAKPRGGTVAVRLSGEENTVQMIVEDDGIGIAKEEQERVFERFYVVEPGRTRAEGSGTGLGLSLVKHTVQNHGGTLDLESALGEGSRFTIRLPRNQIHPEA